MLFRSVFAAALLLLTFSKSTAQSADPLTYIPSKAQNVYVLNLPSIVGKMDVNALKDLDFMKEIMNKANDKQAANFMKNPAESGINFFKPLAIVMTDMDSSSYQSFAIIVPLADAAKFKTMMATGIHPIVQKDGINVIEGDTSVLAWNAQMFVAMSLKKKKADGMSALAGLDSTATPEKLPTLTPSVYFQNSEVNAKATAVRELMRAPHDIYIYQTTDGAGSGMKGMVASMFLGLKPTDLDGNVTSGWVDFENGRIYGEMAQKMNDAMNQKFKSLGRVKPSVDWNQYIAGDAKKTMGMLSLSFNPLGIKEMIAENKMLKQGAEKMAAGKTKENFSMDKILTLFGGDIFATMSGSGEDMKLLFGVSITDKKAVEKLLKDELKAKKMGKNLYVMESKKPVVTEDTPPGMPTIPASPMLMLLKDNVVLIGKEAQILALNAMPKMPTLAAIETTDWQKSLKNKPFNLYFDFKTMGSMLGPLAQGKFDDMPIESVSMSLFNKVTTFELKMMDKDKNALTAFSIFADKMLKKEKTKAKDGMIEVSPDEVQPPKVKDGGN